MAKKPLKIDQLAINQPSIVSGAIGGPATGRLIYQIDIAVWQALNLITEPLGHDLADLHIIIEPRLVTSVGVTGWDIGLQPRNEHLEVKFNARRNDVEEWLDRIGDAAVGNSGALYTFVYNKGASPLLSSVDNLRRIAVECHGDAQKFFQLVAGECVPEAEDILRRLGSNPHITLQTVKIEQLPEAVLKNNIAMISRLLAGAQGQQLYRLLYDQLSHGLTERRVFSVKELLGGAEKNHIVLKLSRAPLYTEYEPKIAATLFLLQCCVTGLPIDVVAHAVDCNVDDLQKQLQGLLEIGGILEEKNCWFLMPLPERLKHPHGNDIVARGLDELTRYIQNQDGVEDVTSQIHNVVALSKHCVKSRPRSVVFVFPLLDKLIKLTGDIHLVLELANLSINAGKAIQNRTRDEAAAVARSFVCGVSWAYQRMPGHLDDARTAYNDSRDIAESIDDRVTLAFICKCLGRLCRLEAEQPKLHGDIKGAKLLESEQLLTEAIQRFSDLPESPLKLHEIADSYSLLARTHLAARDFDKCEKAMRSAYAKMERLKSKEFADLLILNGDLELARHNFSSAQLAYNKALELHLSDNSQSSEIRARAFRQRGLSFLGLRNMAQAKRDLNEAADVWNKLGQRESYAAARWEAIQIEQNLPAIAMELLETESSSVKVAFAELHLQRLSERSSKRAHLSSRDQPDKRYYEQVLREAKQQNAIKNLNE